MRKRPGLFHLTLFPSFPNSVWECVRPDNSVVLFCFRLIFGKEDNGVVRTIRSIPKRSLGTRNTKKRTDARGSSPYARRIR